ncbi:hypothetical protein AGMMS49982_20670 [Bacteroidia bacterium]|nr:hypothetical protein AGMMS49982_20670 [Bacteroidia bacterium]
MKQKTSNRYNTGIVGKFSFKKIATPIYLVIIAGVFFSTYPRIFDEKADMNGDNIHYYALGRALCDGRGFTSTMQFEDGPHTHFPPGYPAFIAVLMKCGADSVHAVKIANGILLFLLSMLLFFVFSAACKNKLLAFTATAFSVSQMDILRFATIIMSEMLFIFFSLVIILIIIRWSPQKAFTDAKKRRKDSLILALLVVCVSYIYFIRSMGLSLILAVILYYGIVTLQHGIDFLKTRKKSPQTLDVGKEKKSTLLRYLLVLGCVVLAFIVPKTMWDIRDKSVGKEHSEYIHDFLKKEGGQTMTTLDDWGDRIVKNTTLYTAKWVPSAIFSYTPDISTTATMSEWLKGIAIALLLLWGVYKLQKGALLLFLYVGITMGVLLIWPEQYGGHRYMLPIIPFLIFLFIYGIYALCELIITQKTKIKQYTTITSVAVCLVFALIAQPTFAASIKGLKSQAKYKTYNYANAAPAFVEFLDAIRWVKDNTPETARICTRKPENFYFYSNGRKGGSFPWYATPEEIVEYMTTSKFDYIIIDHWFPHAYRTLVPAAQKYGDKFKIVHMVGGTQQSPPTYVLKFIP